MRYLASVSRLSPEYIDCLSLKNHPIQTSCCSASEPGELDTHAQSLQPSPPLHSLQRHSEFQSLQTFQSGPCGACSNPKKISRMRGGWGFPLWIGLTWLIPLPAPSDAAAPTASLFHVAEEKCSGMQQIAPRILFLGLRRSDHRLARGRTQAVQGPNRRGLVEEVVLRREHFVRWNRHMAVALWQPRFDPTAAERGLVRRSTRVL